MRVLEFDAKKAEELNEQKYEACKAHRLKLYEMCHLRLFHQYEGYDGKEKRHRKMICSADHSMSVNYRTVSELVLLTWDVRVLVNPSTSPDDIVALLEKIIDSVKRDPPSSKNIEQSNCQGSLGEIPF